MKNLLYSLPDFLQIVVYEFDQGKRETWERVKSQFMKGGFFNKHLKLHYFLLNEAYITKKHWSLRHLTKRPILREWDYKTASASCGKYRSNGTVKWEIPFCINPVTTWLGNIATFEGIHTGFNHLKTGTVQSIRHTSTTKPPSRQDNHPTI